MNLNDLDYRITYEICQNFDIDRSWELLAGAIGYSTSHIQQFELESRRRDGSATKKLLWDWGSRGATVRDLYDKLAMINKLHSRSFLEPIVNPGNFKETKEVNVEDFQTKSDLPSCSVSNGLPSDLSSLTYNPNELPVPRKSKPEQKKSNNIVDVNLNLPDLKQNKTGNKHILEPGASSGEMDECQADGPGKTSKPNFCPASTGRSLENMRSVVEEFGSQLPSSTQLSNIEKDIGIALVSTPEFTYKELSQATDDFKTQKLESGKFGTVYLGVVKHLKCAIKRLVQRTMKSLEPQASMHLASELKALNRYRHENLVLLYGYALDGDEICLVYQYMQNGSLYDCLHCKNNHDVLLSWEQRVSILRGAACGLQYLHSIDIKPVIHGDIKSTNILLDKHFEAKIGDLGVAQHATGGEVRGKMTHITKKNTSIQDYTNRSYYAPEIIRGSGFSVSGDTYAFGVVMYECLTGLESYDEQRGGDMDCRYLVSYIESIQSDCLQKCNDSIKLNKQLLFEDKKLKVPFLHATFTTLFALADRCTMEQKRQRPLMVDVYKELEKCEGTELQHGYVNIQDQLHHISDPSDGSKMCDYSVGQNRISYDHQPSCLLQSPVSPQKHLTLPTTWPKGPDPQILSPIDMLPKNQPLPEAFMLQVVVDKKKQPKESEYVNVNQVSEKIRECYLSDPKKLAEIDKFEKELHFKASKMHEANECEEKIEQDKPEEKIENGMYSYSSDPNKLAMLEKEDVEIKQTSKVEEANYVNVPHAKTSSCVDIVEREVPYPVLDLAKESEEIHVKAMKNEHAMMKVFANYQQLLEKEQLQNDASEDETVDNSEFYFKFDFEKEDSETSTLTESVNNDLDAINTNDINDDDLFAHESQVSYVNVPVQIKNVLTQINTEKISNIDIDASIVHHQERLSMYQDMQRDESEEFFQQRTAHVNTSNSDINVQDQNNEQDPISKEGQMVDCNCHSDHYYENVDTHCHGKNTGQHSANLQGHLMNLQQFCREPTEDDCYV